MGVRRAFGRVTMVVLSAGWLACGGEPCEDAALYQVCDVAEQSCIDEIARAVACRRGRSDFELPNVRFMTGDEVVEEFRTDLTNSTPAAEVERIERTYRGLAQFGLAPADYTFEQEIQDFLGQIAGYYSPQDKEVVVVTDLSDDQFGERTEYIAYVVMVHEMVHYFQDVERDLASYTEAYGTTTDRLLAARASIEGEAVLYELLAELEVGDISPDDFDWSRYWSDYQSFVRQRSSQSDTPTLLAGLHFPYAFGGDLMHGHWQRSGRAGVEAAAVPPPTSVRQVLAWPTTAAPVSPWNQDSSLMDSIVPELPDTYELLDWSIEGVWNVSAMAERNAVLDAELRRLVQAVNADVASWHYDSATDEVVAVWRLRFDTDADASAMQTRLASAGYSTFIAPEHELVVVAGGPPGLITESTPWRSLTMLPTGSTLSRVTARIPGCWHRRPPVADYRL